MKNSESNQQTDPVVPTTVTLGAVRIGVTSAEKALEIWRDVVGLNIIAQTESEISLGIDGNVLIELELGAIGSVQQKSIGLYHVAIHVPTRRNLAEFVVRAIKAGVRIAPTDHLVSEAIYIWDHDGNGIELTFETSWRGTIAFTDSEAYAITKEGKPHSGREAIDLDELLGELEGDMNPPDVLSSKTRIGHVHLHVSDLDEAMVFYRDVIGFAGLSVMRERGMGDVGLGYMPHIVAFNVWAGPQAALPKSGSAGLRWFTIKLPDDAIGEAMVDRLLKHGANVTPNANGFETADPFGNKIWVEIAA